jgi:hypothetical protein
MKRNLFIVAFLVLVMSVVSQPLLTSPAIATSDNPRYDLQNFDNCYDNGAGLPCLVSTGDDEFAVYLAP